MTTLKDLYKQEYNPPPKAIKPIWEKICDKTYRLSVFGGWMVTTESHTGTKCAIFVPDPNHDWVICT